MSSQELERQLEAARRAAEETMAWLTAEVVAARKREEEAEKVWRLQEETQRALERQRQLVLQGPVLRTGKDRGPDRDRDQFC